jgi:hypothetical protein
MLGIFAFCIPDGVISAYVTGHTLPGKGHKGGLVAAMFETSTLSFLLFEVSWILLGGAAPTGAPL